ncbi:MAG: CHAT domain-containing protein [Acidobacteriia bacterium]|nr:CHAT domain-containing protein [Terriglobia bacterium]
MTLASPNAARPKVFCSHRSVDKPRVREIARKLREAGIDAWLDEWEIKPGEDIVAKINEALAGYDVALIFVSKELEGGKWLQAEISAITTITIEDGKQVIPVILDPDVPIPPLLRSRCRLAHDQLNELIDAIYGRTGKPELGPARVAATQRQFLIRLRRISENEIGVAALQDEKPVAAEETVRLGAGFYFSYADFLRARLPGARRPEMAVASDQIRELQSLGDAVGQAVFHGPIASALTGLLKEAAQASEEIDLIIETSDPKLLAIPFEAARLPDGRIPSLENGVRVSRRLSGLPTQGHGPQPGPLKILVAVGAPDEGTTPNAVLDMERELQSILDAVEKARALGNAYVQILDVGSPEEIKRALLEQPFHVLHLSGHGNAGVLDLEDEDGNRRPVTAVDIAGVLRESGKPAPLVFLASCLSGAAGSEAASLAHGLLENGVPAVMAMQTSVTDRYSTQLAAAFYANLATGDRPLASRALALARRDLEQARRDATQRGEHQPPEYATASLFFSRAETAVLDRSLELVRPIEHGRQPASGAVPMLSIGDLIGRRQELRRILRVLTDDERSVAAIGRRSGCQVLGIGGVGKSAVAGRAMSRLADDGWMCVAVSGQWTLAELGTSISAALITAGTSHLQQAAKSLASPDLPDQVRVPLIGQLLNQQNLLLVLDNFEDNLALGGAKFLDPATGNVTLTLCKSAQRGKLLITSRYPVPDANDWLATEGLGPLSDAQMRKMLLRLSGLSSREPEELQLIRRAVGGHPRMLEYLDAILKQGEARLPDVKRRLLEQYRKRGIDLENASVSLDTAMQVALQVGAGDILLDELLALAASHGDREVLEQASVFPRPVSIEGLAFCLSGSRKHANEAQVALSHKATERLVRLSLLTRFPSGDIWVHRWTAEVLSLRMAAEAYRECCRRGGEYLVSGQRSVPEALEAARLFLSAEEFDRAVEEGLGILAFLHRYGQVSDLAAVARELAQKLPPEHQQRYVFIGMEADALVQLGMATHALEQWRIVMDSLESRVLANPGNTEFLDSLSVSYEHMADLMQSLGQGDEALFFFQKALSVRERLSAQEPDRFLRSLSVVYSQMGTLMQSLGLSEQARSFLEKDLEIAERLAKQEPGNIDLLHDLSVSYNKVSGLWEKMGQGRQALSFARKALDIAERLAAQEPSRADFLRDLSMSCVKMGDLMQSLGQVDDAHPFVQKSLDISEHLAAQEPDRADFLRDLSVSYERMGDLLIAA